MRVRLPYAIRKRAREVRLRLDERRSAIRFPPLPHLGTEGRSFTFDYAAGTEIHRSVADGTWSYEPDVMATVLSCLSVDAEAVFVDVGANIGYFPVVVKGVLGDRVSCIAYEPSPNLAAKIRRGARRNGIELDVRPVAASNEVGTATFYLSARSDASNSLNAGFRRHRGQLTVDVTTIDADLLGRIPESARPVLLIDTETTEPDVLEGARAFISRYRPAIVCEVLAGRTEERLQDIVDSIGYDSFALTDAGLELRDRIEGDTSYRHRDWLFWPSESRPPVDSIASTLEVLTAAPAASGARGRRSWQPARPSNG